MTGFIFGGDTGLSYEALQRRRDIANEMMKQRGTPRTVGQGINSFAGSIAGALMNKKLDKREQELRASADDMFNSVFGGSEAATGGVGYEGPGAIGGGYSEPMRPVTQEGDIGADTMAVLGKPTDKPVSADVIREGLVKRGLPGHVADAFVMNFKDESGLNPGINERNPIVPGSRGGFGLAQWTGPRRKQLEQFARETGRPISSVDTQLDFLMQELSGSEKKAAQDILSAQDAPTAAAAIVNRFLRPSEQYRAQRSAKYMGGAPTQVQTAQASSGPSVQQIAAALGNPIIQQDPGKVAVLNALMQQKMQANDPLRQLQIQKGNLEIQQMQNPERKIIKGADGRNYYLDTGEPVFPGVSAPVDQPTSVEEYNFAREQGFEGTYEDWITAKAQAGASRVTVGGSSPGIGKLSTDYGYVLDPQTGEPVIDPETGLPQAAAVPGSPAAREIAETKGKEEEKDRQQRIKMGTTLTNLQMNIDEVEDGGIPVTGPLGAAAGLVPGTAASDWRVRNQQITTEGALAEIQNMRDNSPTGGAVGQLTDSEREAIALAATGLSSAQSKSEYIRAAKNYRKVMLDTAFGEGNWRLSGNGEIILSNGGSENEETGGISTEDYSTLSDEELLRRLQGDQ